MHVTAFAKYGRMAASTRQRILQYAPVLASAGIDLDLRVLLDDEYVASLADGTRYPMRKIGRAYLRRLHEVGFERLGEVLLVYSELLPWFPGSLERWLLMRRGRPIVFDLDDAFFHAYDQHSNPLLRSIYAPKFELLLRGAAACMCGNEYIRQYAAQFCRNTVVIPTVVDTDTYLPAAPRQTAQPVIGWIGSPSTWSYVRPLLGLLESFVMEGRARVHVIGAGTAVSGSELPWIHFVDWSELTEVAEVQRMDIGIMPLPDEPWARGKSGYKLVQYMACGVPAVASPVGANNVILKNCGFLARSVDEWQSALSALLNDPALRRKLGASSRRRAVEHYSLSAHGPRVRDLILGLVP